MSRFSCYLFIWLMLATVEVRANITVLAYHDVADQASRQMSVGNSTVSTENLRAQFEW
ncbi:MAG: hypothetical protein RLZZ226_1494, partial [Pseudomonadota bacterium]